MKKILTVVIATVLLSACQSGPSVYSSNPNAAKSSTGGPSIQTLALSTVDFEYAAKKAVEKFLSSKFATKQGGGRYVASMGTVKNDTTLRISTGSMTDRMIDYMTESGNFIFTGAVGAERTDFTADSRQLNKSALFDKKTTAKNGTVIAPDLEMTGIIRQRTVVGADRQSQQIEYEFSFRVIEANTGLQIFNTLVPIDKLGSNDNFSW